MSNDIFSELINSTHLSKIVKQTQSLCFDEYEHINWYLEDINEQVQMILMQERQISSFTLTELVAGLSHDSHDIQLFAVWGIHSIGENLSIEQKTTVMPQLTTFLSHTQCELRIATAFAISNLKLPQSALLLSQILYEESETSIIKCICYILGIMGDKTAIPALMHLVKKADASSIIAVETLGAIGNTQIVPDLLTLLQKNNKLAPELIGAIMETLGELKDRRAVPILITRLQKETDVTIRHHICTALGKIGDEQVIPTLIALVKQADPSLFSVAIALSDIGNTTVIPILFEVLDRDDIPLRDREGVAIALSEFDDEKIALGLIRFLNRRNKIQNPTPDEIVFQHGIAMTLSRFNSNILIPDLLVIIDQLRNPTVCEWVVYAFRNIEPFNESADILVNLLRDHPNAYIRGFAIKTLRDMFEKVTDEQIKKKVVNTLIKSLSDTRECVGLHGSYVGEAAANALYRINTPEAQQAIKDWESVTNNSGNT
ncbi:MAG TPA: HEAT repeat domain-containing protein [Anaerolineae bacterium]|nr:HEAT repeat domain-containing protein [Anaerolineae bacterium]